jgi:hypothetical protein
MVKDFMGHFDDETADTLAFYNTEEKLAEQGRSFINFVISPTSVLCPFESKIINKEEELRTR